jgi:ATP-binding cassette subfamily F protein 3
MLHVVNLTVEFGGRSLFQSLNWHIKKKDRVALIGMNGSGKSTLLKIIAKEAQPTSGSVAHRKDLHIGYLPQEGLHAHGKNLMHEVLTAFTEIVALHDRMKAIEIQMQTMDHESEAFLKLIEGYGNLQHRFEDLQGFSIESKAARVLTGLGFKEADFEKPCELFSGGWQMRIAIAKLLLQNPDLLLLDEPTNHLDLDSIEWFENYLRNYDGSVLLVSHDRYFINNVCNRITELERKQLNDYFGSYEEFEEQKALAEEQLISSYERQQDEMKRVQLFIDRFRYKATKARQAQSRIKMLERMEKIQLPEEERRAVNFRFPQPVKSGRVVLEAENIVKSFGDNHVLKGISFLLERGERVAFVGVNGAGKSTLLRILSGTDTNFSGAVKLGYNVTMEYFAQQQAEKLDLTKTVYEEIVSAGSGQTHLMMRTILGAFLFSGDDVYKKVGVLSGGEKSRLAFAKMLLHPANFIILDEPTNHIDAQTKEILQGALTDYEGTLLVVSHDRYFLDSLVNKVIEVKEGVIKTYLGNYGDFHQQKESEREKAEAKASEKKGNPGKKQPSHADAVKKTESKKISSEQKKRTKRLAALEKEIQDQEKLKQDVETQLADPSVYKQKEKSIHLQNAYQAINEKITTLYEEWEKLE